jgi:CRP-like cAMP-binding protein
LDPHLKHICATLGIRYESLDVLNTFFNEIKVRKGEYLLREGQIARHLYYIVTGCMQVFSSDDKDAIHTFRLATENQWVSEISSFEHQTPSPFYIKCVEPARIIRIHHESYRLLCQKEPAFAFITKELWEQSYHFAMDRARTLHAMNALERIKWLINQEPKLMTRLPHKLLASYLDISPQTMTRLKAKL